MLKHFLKTSFRNLIRNKTHALINIFGLSLGMLCALIIFQKVRYELSFDQFQSNKDQIYRVLRVNHNSGSDDFGSGVPYPLPKTMHEDFQDFPALTVVDAGASSPVISIPDAVGNVKRFMEEEGVAYVEKEYFQMFDQEWITGDPNTAFNNPYTVVISRSLAEKYYGKSDVLGEVFNYNGQYDLKITGIIEDAPENTSLPFNMLVNFHLGEKDKRGNDSWGSVSSSTQCFVMLEEGVKPEDLDQRFKDYILKHAGEDRAEELSLALQPLTDIHFETELSNFRPATAKENIWVLILIGIFLIVTACINFINLNTVLVFRRAKEVGLRKVLGSLPHQISNYFLSETAVIALISLIFAMAMAPVAIHYMDELMQAPLKFNPFLDGWLAIFILAMIGVVVLLSGGYPALLLSRIHPVMALKKQVDKSYGKGLNLRRGLVIVQFMISQVLIISTLVMMQQMDHFYNMPLGYDQDAIYEVYLPSQDMSKLNPLKNELLLNPGISSVAYSNSGASSNSRWISNFVYRPSDDEENIVEGHTHIKMVDQDYISTFGMNLLAGEGLIKQDSVDRFVINETMAKSMGFENPVEAVGTVVSNIYGYKAPVAGVIQDFHTTSLHDQMSPTVLMYVPQYYTAAIKIANPTPEVLSHIEEKWQAAFPDKMFDGKFLDENIAEFYEEEQRSASLFQLFAGIAIFIGCMGLFGLISFMAAQRTREIGIRKVLGASVGNILNIFSREFAVLVVIGFVIAAPLAWWGMNSWLQDFAYRINIGFGVFFLAVLVSMIVVMMTVGYKSYRAATINPTQALRDE